MKRVTVPGENVHHRCPTKRERVILPSEYTLGLPDGPAVYW